MRFYVKYSAVIDNNPDSDVVVVPPPPLWESRVNLFLATFPDAKESLFKMLLLRNRNLHQALKIGIHKTRLPTSIAVLISRMHQMSQTGSTVFVKTATLSRIAESICWVQFY
ncbi:hypothetical protein ColLi_00189 [Colletotrichum liriopes]|uniref:Uncharacterized protein n=1 Tax=Colletotrichum liriopes TaxID=708192 RepID=A0AA37LM06_9PEZI|nr:hypothetical protein ColLi_00189 [Colletotrichum liriopes]